MKNSRRHGTGRALPGAFLAAALAVVPLAVLTNLGLADEKDDCIRQCSSDCASETETTGDREAYTECMKECVEGCGDGSGTRLLLK
jgi:hypothetical protein